MKGVNPVSEVRDAVARELLPWFAQHQRDLPWRKRRTPYRVWLAELMLHQTRVDQVVPYYRRFLQRFPSVRQLAAASLDEVLKQWEGLGYYARARNAHQTAQYLCQHRGGRFPRTYKELLQLPGIGPYTAAAIASLAFNLDYAVLDGNVIRVLARLTAYREDVRRPSARQHLQTIADQLLLPGQAAACNEAWMELGALTCTPRNPQCPSCPLHCVCKAYRSGQAAAFPRRARRQPVPHKVVGAAIVMNRRGEVLVAQRRTTSMLGGLWEFPGGTQEPEETMATCVAREWKEELGVTLTVGPRLLFIHHAYSHFTIELHVHAARIRAGRPRTLECADYCWLPVPRLRERPFSKADLHIISFLEKAAFTPRAWQQLCRKRTTDLNNKRSSY